MTDELTWSDLSEEVQETMIKYLKLLERFERNPDLLSFKHKEWVLENANLPTNLIPIEILKENNLKLP